MSEKRQLLIDTALTLFYERGIQAVGINEILRVSGVAKKTLYHHFKNKNALVLAALKQRHDILMFWLEKHLTGAKSNEEVIEKLFNKLEDWFKNKSPDLGEFRGCLYINSSIEFSDPKSEIHQFAQVHKQKFRETIEKYLPNPSDALVDAICILREGAITMAYVSKDVSIPKKCIAILKNLE